MPCPLTRQGLDPYDPPADEEDDPQEYHNLLPRSTYGSISPAYESFPRRMGMAPSRAHGESKTRCRLLSVLFGALGLVVLITVIGRKPSPVPELAVGVFATDDDAMASTSTSKSAASQPAAPAEKPATKSSGAPEAKEPATEHSGGTEAAKPATTYSAGTEAPKAKKPATEAPKAKSHATEAPKTKTETEASKAETRPANPVIVPEAPVPSKSGGNQKSEDTQKKPQATPAPTTRKMTPRPTTEDKKFVDDEKRELNDLKKEAAAKRAQMVKEATRTAADMVTVAKTAAATLETSAVAAEQRAISQATLDASKQEIEVDSYADDLQQKSKEAAVMYQQYVAKATAAGDALQHVLEESEASSSAADVVAAAQKIQFDWADYVKKRDTAAEALENFKKSTMFAPHAALYSDLPVVLLVDPSSIPKDRQMVMRQQQLVQFDWSQYIPEEVVNKMPAEARQQMEVDWRQYVPGFANGNEMPKWAKWVPGISFGGPATGSNYLIPQGAIDKIEKAYRKSKSPVDWRQFIPGMSTGESPSDGVDWRQFVPGMSTGESPSDGLSPKVSKWVPSGADGGSSYIPQGAVDKMEKQVKKSPVDWTQYVPGMSDGSDQEADWSKNIPDWSQYIPDWSQYIPEGDFDVVAQPQTPAPAIDWTKFIPGWGTANAPDWAKYIPAGALPPPGAVAPPGLADASAVGGAQPVDWSQYIPEGAMTGAMPPMGAFDVVAQPQTAQKKPAFDWTKFIPGWGTANAPDWAKFIPTAKLPPTAVPAVPATTAVPAVTSTGAGAEPDASTEAGAEPNASTEAGAEPNASTEAGAEPDASTEAPEEPANEPEAPEGPASEPAAEPAADGSSSQNSIDALKNKLKIIKLQEKKDELKEALKEAEKEAASSGGKMNDAADKMKEAASSGGKMNDAADKMKEAASSQITDQADKAQQLLPNNSPNEDWNKAKNALDRAGESASDLGLPPASQFAVADPAWQDLAAGNLPSAWMGCGYMPAGMRIGCCLQTVCGSVTSTGMMDPVGAINFTNTLSCTSSAMDTASCFDDVTDTGSVQLKECLACNDCMAKPDDLNCPDTGGKTNVMHFG